MSYEFEPLTLWNIYPRRRKKMDRMSAKRVLWLLLAFVAVVAVLLMAYLEELRRYAGNPDAGELFADL